MALIVTLNDTERDHQPDYMFMLSTVLVDESIPLHVRNAAGLALKNALSARVRARTLRHASPRSQPHPPQEAPRQEEFSAKWMALSIDQRTKIKQDALLTLASPQQKAGAFAAQVVSAIAAVELPQGQWADLIEVLLGFVNNQANTNLKIATLQAIGFICESIVRGVACRGMLFPY